MALKEHVTLEEFDQQFHDTINGYYEHAKNDPSISNEEAIANTAQMTEQYLEAREEFIANMQAENLGQNAGAAQEAGVAQNSGAAQNTGVAQGEEAAQGETLSNDEGGIQGEEGGIDNEGGIEDDGGMDNDEGGIDGDDDGGIE